MVTFMREPASTEAAPASPAIIKHHRRTATRATTSGLIALRCGKWKSELDEFWAPPSQARVIRLPSKRSRGRAHPLCVSLPVFLTDTKKGRCPVSCCVCLSRRVDCAQRLCTISDTVSCVQISGCLRGITQDTRHPAKLTVQSTRITRRIQNNAVAPRALRECGHARAPVRNRSLSSKCTPFFADLLRTPLGT